jgi:cation diffusion facilitator CzcD-associated flavoprotein CzcO
VVSALGLLNYPKYPDWPGLDDFAGPKFHTFRWEHEHDLTGKRVAVVGTGSTATQVVPEIAPLVDTLYLFQREPGWVVPKGTATSRPKSAPSTRARCSAASPAGRRRTSSRRTRSAGRSTGPAPRSTRLREQQCRSFIERVFADRPDLAEAVTPKYPYPGKRPILNSTFYPALLRENVELVPRAVQSVTEKGVVDADGNEYLVDVLVMATGFQPASYLSSLEVVGAGGRTIHEAWAGEPQALLGMTVPGFPNFFILYGPNTNGGEIVSCLERQAEHVVTAAKRLMRTGRPRSKSAPASTRPTTDGSTARCGERRGRSPTTTTRRRPVAS